MAPGASRRNGRLLVIAAVIGVAAILIVWTAISLVPSPSTSSAATARVLVERTLPNEILTAGASYQEANWQWPFFDNHPCTNVSAPAVNCTSLNVTLDRAGYYNFSFEVTNAAAYSAQIADLETNVNFSYASVPSQYCNGGGVPEVWGPTVGADSAMLITMNLTFPITPGTFNPDLTLVTVMGGCSGQDCSWGC